MNVIRTKYRKTQIKAINLIATNGTMIIAPNYKGERVNFIINGHRIATNLAKDKSLRKIIYDMIQEQYNEFRSLLS